MCLVFLCTSLIFLFLIQQLHQLFILVVKYAFIVIIQLHLFLYNHVQVRHCFQFLDLFYFNVIGFSISIYMIFNYSKIVILSYCFIKYFALLSYYHFVC
jgi:hypothetical protein